MDIIDYTTLGGKNVITDLLDQLPISERVTGYKIRDMIEVDGEIALQAIKTRQLRKKLWEIKFADNRIMYVLTSNECIYFLHACKKQKNKSELPDLNKAIRRAKNFGLKID